MPKRHSPLHDPCSSLPLLPPSCKPPTDLLQIIISPQLVSLLPLWSSTVFLKITTRVGKKFQMATFLCLKSSKTPPSLQSKKQSPHDALFFPVWFGSSITSWISWSTTPPVVYSVLPLPTYCASYVPNSHPWGLHCVVPLSGKYSPKIASELLPQIFNEMVPPQWHLCKIANSITFPFWSSFSPCLVFHIAPSDMLWYLLRWFLIVPSCIGV